MTMAATVVARLADLGDPGAREFFIGDGDWPFRGFLVQVDGRLRAYANVCPHKQHPLNLADDEFLVAGQKLLRCASHNALFVPESGLCVFGPCAGRSLKSSTAESTARMSCNIGRNCRFAIRRR